MTELHVLIPVKRLSAAKSRLQLPLDERRRVARALVEHTLRTVTTCVGSGLTTVVTADPDVALLADEVGANPVHDPHLELNPAIAHGLSTIPPDASALVLFSDLPLLSVESLDQALALLSPVTVPSFIPDATGRGTTSVLMPPGQRLPTVFGPNSASKFLRAGWDRIENAPTPIRADLDTISDLHTYGLPHPVVRAYAT